MNQLGNFAFRRTKHLVGIDGFTRFFLFPLVFILGRRAMRYRQRNRGTMSTAATGRTLPLTHDAALIGPFVPAPSTYVPFFSWRKGLTLCPNGTSGGGAVHSFAPQLRLGCGAFFDLRQHTSRSRVYWQSLRGPFFSDGEPPSGKTQLGAFLFGAVRNSFRPEQLGNFDHSDE